jgi:molecular chaperone DnaK
MKFFNIVNEIEENIGDLWLGIDKNQNRTAGPLEIEITLKIDENNLVEVAACLKELRDIELSKTLSRGKADEKLFLSLEELINSANRKAYSEYVIIDLTSRVLSIVKDIRKAIDKKTDELIEPVYNLAEMKIDKAEKMAEQEITSKPLIYYANDVLQTFGRIIPASDQSVIRARIKKLQEMDEHGTFEENLKSYKKLDASLDRLKGVNTLMTIKKAGEACEEHEPAKAAKFFNAVEDILKTSIQKNSGQMGRLINEIIPQAHEILDNYDSNTGIIHKDITL